MLRGFEEDWERRRGYLIRTMFADPPALSPVPEESTLDSHSLREATEPTSRRDEATMPDFIVERVPRRRDEDETEEFYYGLRKRMRRYYRKLFNLGRGDSSSVEDDPSNYTDNLDLTTFDVVENVDLNKSFINTSDDSLTVVLEEYDKHKAVAIESDVYSGSCINLENRESDVSVTTAEEEVFSIDTNESQDSTKYAHDCKESNEKNTENVVVPIEGAERDSERINLDHECSSYETVDESYANITREESEITSIDEEESQDSTELPKDFEEIMKQESEENSNEKINIRHTDIEQKEDLGSKEQIYCERTSLDLESLESASNKSIIFIPSVVTNIKNVTNVGKNEKSILDGSNSKLLSHTERHITEIFHEESNAETESDDQHSEEWDNETSIITIQLGANQEDIDDEDNEVGESKADEIETRTDKDVNASDRSNNEIGEDEELNALPQNQVDNNQQNEKISVGSDQVGEEAESENISMDNQNNITKEIELMRSQNFSPSLDSLPHQASKSMNITPDLVSERRYSLQVDEHASPEEIVITEVIEANTSHEDFHSLLRTSTPIPSNDRINKRPSNEVNPETNTEAKRTKYRDAYTQTEQGLHNVRTQTAQETERRNIGVQADEEERRHHEDDAEEVHREDNMRIGQITLYACEVHIY